MARRCGWVAVLGLVLLGSVAQAGVGVSVGLSFPIGGGRGHGHFHGRYPRGCWGPHTHLYGLYRPYPVYVAPPPVYYQPVPVVVQPAPVYAPVAVQPAPVAVQPAPVAPVAPVASASPGGISSGPANPVSQVRLEPQPSLEPIARANHSAALASWNDPGQALGNVRHPDERVRLEAVTQLGRTSAPQAIDALNGVLARDPIPAVRDAAARALGAIGKPGGLAALRNAAAGDPDPEVRRSAQYSLEVIQAQFRGQ